MRRTVVIVPGLVGEPGGESVLRQPLPALQGLALRSTVFKVSPIPPVDTPEALYLGLAPGEGQMRQGPLMVAALGADPPERSVHFHVSLLSVQGDAVVKPPYVPTAEEERRLWSELERLNTRTLTLLQGEKLDHALVWEGLGEFKTHSPEGGSLSLREHRPEGDAEAILRRLIDDSVNLLSELELNQRRVDDGLPPFNIVWPWGEGRRLSVPNLALRRGEPATVESGSFRMQGLTRLAGYAHSERASVGFGMKTRFADLAKRALGRDLTIAVLLGAEKLRSQARLEELEWFARELDRELLSPLADDVVRNESRLVFLSPPLGLTTAARSERELPFDERALEEKGWPRGRSGMQWRLGFGARRRS